MAEAEHSTCSFFRAPAPPLLPQMTLLTSTQNSLQLFPVPFPHLPLLTPTLTATLILQLP